MILVPADTSERHTDSWKEPMIGSGSEKPKNEIIKTVQTPGDAASRLDTELSNILRSTKFHDDADKWKQYLQVLQRYLFLVGMKHSSFNDTNVAETASASLQNQSMNDDVIVKSVPLLYKRKADSLVSYLRNTSEIANRVRWDQQGRMILDGVLKPDYNIIDLINDSVRFRKTFRAKGREEFINILRASAIPREFIGNQQLWDSRPLQSYKRTRSNSTDTDGENNVEERVTHAEKRRKIILSRPSRKWLRIANK